MHRICIATSSLCNIGSSHEIAFWLQQQKAATEADLQWSMLNYSAMIIEARRRRMAWLRSMRKGEDFLLDYKSTQVIWKQWQDEWQGNEERKMATQIKNPRSMFNTYCYHAVGIRHLVWLVLQTGRDDTQLCSYLRKDALLDDMQIAAMYEPKCRLSQKGRRDANRKERQKGQQEGNTGDEIKGKKSAAHYSQQDEICTVRRILNELDSA